MKVFEFLTTSAQRFPDKAAVVHGPRRVSYGFLNAWSDAIAASLRGSGLRAGDRVALLIENSPESVAAYFGILKAGGVVVAMNTQLVERELQAVTDDCAPRFILTDAGRQKRAAALHDISTVRPAVFRVEEAGLVPVVECSGADTEPPPVPLAAIMYTSGTTGKPKGVMLTHENIVANTGSIIEYLGINDTDSMMVILPFYYSYGASLLTTHIKAGGTLVLDNRFLYPNTILETMQRENVTGFAGVPSHYAILLRKSALRSYPLPSLRYVTQAGGAMSTALISEFREIVPHARFFVMYGQTEASARLSYLPPEMLETKNGSIGKGIPGVTLAVVSENDDTPVLTGEAGEIVAEGDNIMRGYWRAPEETAKVLRHGRLYTGDLARVDKDGFIYIVSRKKDMIKCGANRISPFEIEDVVCQLPGVMECAAVGIPDEILGEAIKLCVVPSEGVSLTDKDVMLYCRENLASFKFPKIVEFYPALPKTASGKIKREELKGNGDCQTIRPSDYQQRR